MLRLVLQLHCASMMGVADQVAGVLHPPSQSSSARMLGTADRLADALYPLSDTDSLACWVPQSSVQMLCTPCGNVMR